MHADDPLTPQIIGCAYRVADLPVEGQLLIELKACKDLDEVQLAQCLNYLKATGLKVCLLMHFGKSKIQVRRLMMNQGEIQLEPVMHGDGQ